MISPLIYSIRTIRSWCHDPSPSGRHGNKVSSASPSPPPPTNPVRGVPWLGSTRFEFDSHRPKSDVTLVLVAVLCIHGVRDRAGNVLDLVLLISQSSTLFLSPIE